MVIKRFPKSKKFRVIIGDACFYATANEIRSGVGDFVKCNAALLTALKALELQRMSDKQGMESMGFGGIMEGLNVQLNIA
jgi:hypothetical protein